MKWLIIITAFLLPLSASSNNSIPAAKWWCGFQGQILECQRNQNGIIEPTIPEYLVYKYFFDDFENALKVFRCESGISQYWENGEVIISKTNDIGISQINLTTHQKTAEDLGLDLWNPEHNVAFARLLYNKQKWVPWVCAKLTKIIKNYD